MPAVDPTDVASLQEGDVASVIPVITTMAKAYTRGNGFDGNEPNEEIAAVITTASARLAANPDQLASDYASGPFSRSLRGGFGGWSTAERFVLDRYRTRAM